MTREELLEYCRNLYKQEGLEALSYPKLKTTKGLYNSLYSKGLNQRTLIKELGLQEKFKQEKGDFFTRNYNGKQKSGWTWRRIVETAKKVQEKEGFLPPAGWFQQNGHGSLVQSVYYLRKDWEALRKELDDFSSSSFVESRNGMRWRSHPEASLSNFLYSRGIEHKRGERYPDEYAKMSASNYGYFDIHFLDKTGNWIDVEIWGDKPHGHNEDKYKAKRNDKEEFNKDNLYFIGIHFNECFKEERLTQILHPYIGYIEPFQFERSTDKIIPSTHWSNTDELLGYCKEFASKMPDGNFPTEEWLRKRGKWSEREGEAYNTLAVYIKTWFGGIRNLRKLIDQENVSTTVWDKEAAITEYKAFYKKHGLTAGQVRHGYRKKKGQFSDELYHEAARIDSAIIKYAGGISEINDLLGIKIERPRKWTKEKVIEGHKEIIDRWGLSANQLINDHKKGTIKLSIDEYKKLGQLIDVTNREFGGIKKIMQILNFTPPSRKHNRRKKSEINKDS